ncbi:MAG: tRNA(Met) cytidine acetyltransferase [Halothiobacillaceae bacterium]|nr:tRNA(Met) cytidine acetyltransferase [Halothiobacillaceae bacterium]HER35549.1 tRNA(Met) cytidine acetyltransferase [Halothiobacillaceae bacterium]
MTTPTPREGDLRATLEVALSAWRRAGHRLPILITGSPAWARATASALVNQDTLWVGPDAPASVRSLSLRRARESLGGECERVVVNALSGFDPDALGAVAGLPRAGGCLILLVPPLADWPERDDPELARITPYPFTPADAGSAYLRRLTRLLDQSHPLWTIREGEPRPRVPPPAEPVASPEHVAAPCRTADQAEAVEGILHVARGRPRRPLVLRSHRGRGKSSALGIAAARVLAEGLGDVLVTAPRREAVEPLFARAAEISGAEIDSDGALRVGAHRLRFVPPDVLIEQCPPGRLLLIDEAAALTAGLLDDLFARYPRCVFATTEHGYEGSGRGFGLRFLPRLESRAISVHHRQMTTPIRWAPHDPLETLIDRLLLLDADPADLPTVREAMPPRRLDRDALADDEPRLAELFGLLVGAHYRTTPRDLRQMLDAPGTDLWAIEVAGRVLATAVVQDEGNLSPSLAEAVFAGERRLHGHLLPQTMAAHAGQPDWPTLAGRRIQRIAVHPDARRRGLGKRLVAAIAEQARADGMDFLGVSFGAADELVDFWQACNLVGLHLGQHRDPASGEQAMVMVTGISPAGTQAVGRDARWLVATLADRAAGPLRHTDPCRITRLLASTTASALPTLDESECRQIEACAQRRHHLDAALGPLRRWLPVALTQPTVIETVTPANRALLVGRFLQLAEDSRLATHFDLAGRSAAETACRDALGQVLAATRKPPHESIVS